MNAAMLMLVASTFNAPQPATTNELSSHSNFTMGHKVTFVSTSPALFQGATKSAQKASPTHQAAGKTITVFIDGGVNFAGGNTGFQIGVGAGFIPMKDHKQFEVNADFNFVHIANTNGWYISFNGQYNFILKSHEHIKPFGGAGIAFGSFNYGGFAALNLFGGIESALSSGRAIRIQVRWTFTDATLTQIIFGIAF